MQNKRRLGSQKEELAAGYLESQGAEIIDRNYYFRGGELDLIAKDGEYLCFIEVKYRTSSSFGFPEEAVTSSKQKKILTGARVYLYHNHLPEDTPCRFDVVSVCKNEINWIKNAFTV